MARHLEYLGLKRYWVLILLGPPLRAIFAYAVFAGLHLGLGLPWPTLEDAGILASLLEMLGFLVLLVAAEFLVLGLIYRMNLIASFWSIREIHLDTGERLVSFLGFFAGFLILIGASNIMPGISIIGHENGGIAIFLVVLIATFPFVATVQHGERTLRERAEAGTEAAGA